MSKRLAGVCALIVGMTAYGAKAGGIGVLGDSYSDEYQFYAPHRASARNWVEILAKSRGVDFGQFRSTSWSEPRNQGYAFNWAKSGATTAAMIASGQHKGLAEQVARGEVDVAVIFIGGNDFIEALNSSAPQSSLEGLGHRAAGNVKEAGQALLSASSGVRLLVATVPDIRDLPEFRDVLRAGRLSPTLAAQAADEVDTFNADLRAMAATGSRVAIFDFAKISRISQVLSPKYVKVGDRRVNREPCGDGPEHLFLGDARHLGTMGQGMLAKFMIGDLNRKCGTTIKALDDREIVELADSLAPSAIAAVRSEGTPRQAD